MKPPKVDEAGYGKLLDAWLPPEWAGDPVGCVATTFTFNADFFEEECLSRFLGLETEASETKFAYVIEREEKLSQARCAVLVDQHHARGVRSLRWDLLSARLPRGHGILHAKVSLLVWTQHIRLIVASANLTEPGYRRNHEVFAALDYFVAGDESDGSPSPLSVLDEVIEFLRETVKLAVGDDAAASPTGGHWNDLLDKAASMSRSWGATGEQRGSEQPYVFAVLTGLRPTNPKDNVFDVIKDRRRDKSPLTEAYVVSPFFDDGPAKDNRPAREIWNCLKQRGEAFVEYHVTTEDGHDGVLVHAPELKDAQPSNRSGIETRFEKLDFTRRKVDADRQLHAKCLWFENDWSMLYLVGSSNFTSPGLGLCGRRNNIEANLCFEVFHERQREAAKALKAAWFDTVEITDKLKFKPRKDDDEDDCPNATVELLPAEFVEAIFSRDADQHGWIELRFQCDPRRPPSGWALFIEDSQQPFVSEPMWQADGSPTTWRVKWDHERPPYEFEVCWEGSHGRAWWPVNLRDDFALPPPSELKNLPLDLLIEILTTSKPLHRVLSERRERQAERDGINLPPETDPHRRVDTSGFLLQKTRRVSWALRELGERLARPVASEQALNWRLRGPVGVLALAQAIDREAKSATERTFLLAELCLELHRVQPQSANEQSLPVKRVRAAIRDIIAELRPTIVTQADNTETSEESDALAKYVDTVFKKALS